MASFKIKNVAIRGISAVVPKNKVSNLNNPIFESIEDAERFVNITGVENKYIADDGQCTSDLSVIAVNDLLTSLNWSKDDVEILIVVTQTPDYPTPLTSILLQDRLGFSKECIAFDVPLGCSGYVYGLSILGGMMSASNLRKGILVAGDTLSKQASPKDKSTSPLFGDASTATAVEFDNDAPEMFFNLGSDGSGNEAIIVRDGGYRHPFSLESLEYKDYGDGVVKNNCQTTMQGMDVFTFAISTAPKTMKKLMEFCGKSIEDFNFVVFHQANKFMNETVRKKLKITVEQNPYSLDKYGNTASATIPLTMVSEMKNQLENEKLNIAICGFGVGLSWGSAYIQTDNIKILPVKIVS